MAEYLSAKNLSSYPHLKHGFFTTLGGISDSIYKSLNCGVHSHDDKNNVIKNRKIAVTSLSDTAKLVEIHQTHSNVVHVIKDDLSVVKADAVITKERNIALSVVTADCAPVLIADPMANIIGAIHAGHTGARNDIIQNTVTSMCEQGAKVENIIASIGPCIAQKSYEVGTEFKSYNIDDKFLEQSPENNDKFMFDLEGYVEQRLIESGIKNIEKLSVDTYDIKNNCFSYRRKTHLGENDYGRQISIILQK